MSGYIEYVDTSVLSPLYPHPIEMGGNFYASAHEAIQAGENPSEVILLLVRNNRSLYNRYRQYIFRGTYSDLLNTAIQTLLVPKQEPIDTGRYILPLQGDLQAKARQLPIEYSIPIIRNVYILARETSSPGRVYDIYQQTRALDTVEQYNVFLLEGIPLYVGSMGAFFLLENRDSDVSAAISRLR